MKKNIFKRWKKAVQWIVSAALLLSLLGGVRPGFSLEQASPAGLNQASLVELDPGRIRLTPAASGLDQPLVIANAGDGSGRLFIGERAGIIRILQNGTLSPAPFLDMDSIVNSGSAEQGLLSVAFHPQYESNGYFYTLHTNATGAIVLSRFTVSPAASNQVSLNTRVELLAIPHPTHTNHNGGTLAFGPDGYLYWSTGDGGGAGDPFNNAQNLASLLGKILRLDVNSTLPYAIPLSNPFYNSTNTSIRKEIWAYGLRNPWRLSFDRLTQDLYIGDVGQGSREEIDFQPAASGGGENYGWDVMEGSICYNAATCDLNNKVLPVTEYTHAVGCSVTGGYVYRGTAYPSLQGHYFYGDYCQGQLFNLYRTDANGWAGGQLLDTSYGISTFGEDENSELYLTDYFGGVVYRLGYDETTFRDVPSSNPFWRQIEILYANGITSGCSSNPLLYCPLATVTRDQMAVFLLVAKHGAGYAPPDATGVFADVPVNYWAAKWIEQLAKEGITSGCGGGNYCPTQPVTRDQMAVFLLAAKHGTGYAPPEATGVFADVPVNYWAAKWIEQLAEEGITAGCGNGNYCPTQPVTRDQMAVFLVSTFNLPVP
jgi:glucose/arabinose dehydrogenase